MSEEVRNASTDVARSMLLSLAINGCLALGMLFAVLFSVPMDRIFEILTKSGGFPVILIFKEAVGSTAGATIMGSIIIVLEFCSALGCLAAASRMTWSFARDRGLPYSRYVSMVCIYIDYKELWLISDSDRSAYYNSRRGHRCSHSLFRPSSSHQYR